MASIASTTVICPNCRQPFSAQVQQIFDVNQDPAAKNSFLRWRPPVARCPRCGYNGALATPLIYHDPEKELLLVHVPLELGMRQGDQERTIGALTNRIINALPPERRKGYLLTPRMSLSYQGMVDTILNADGITPEMINAQRERIELIERLMHATDAELPVIAKENDGRLDASFFLMLSASIESAAGEGQQQVAQQLASLRERLLPLTTVGQRAQRQAAAIDELRQSAGEKGISPELLLDRLISTEDEAVVEALVAAARPLIDYNFFILLAERIGAADGRGDKAEAERLKGLREKILSLTAEIDKRNRAVLDQAAGTLRSILQAPDMDAALREHAQDIDDAFMAVLEANLEAAQQAGQQQALQRLQLLSNKIMQLVQAGAPPEIQFINEILGIENEADLDRLLQENRETLTPELLGLMADIADNMRENERAEVAERLDQLRGKMGRVMAGG